MKRSSRALVVATLLAVVGTTTLQDHALGRRRRQGGTAHRMGECDGVGAVHSEVAVSRLDSYTAPASSWSDTEARCKLIRDRAQQNLKQLGTAR